MFGWLLGRKKKQGVWQSMIPPMILRDSWEACGGGFYVTQFRREIEGIANSLSSSGNTHAHARFNGEKRCAEIYDKDGTIAYIAVHGGMGLPETVIVTSDLSTEGQELFMKAFPRLKIKFYELSSLF